MSQIIPVEVELNVAESVNQYELAVAENSVPVSVGVSTQIVAGTTEEYAGPYSVTPSESEQTLATTDLKMTGDVTVEAVPSDYVGSAVPRRTKNDISITKIVMPGGVQTPVAIAAKGYYESNTTKNIPTGAATTPATSITVNPTVSVDSNGLVTASVSASQSVTPTVNEGYVMSGTAGTVSVQGNSTLHLSTQAGETITPTESEQTAVAEHKYTTGDVKVGAISSTYVGSGIDRNDSTNLTASGKTVTAPSGYYESNATKSVADASWLAGKTIETDPSVSVDANGLITSSYLYSTTMKPISASGWADKNHTVSVTVKGTGTHQLTTKGSSDLTASGKTVTAPAGYYPSAATKDVADATWKSASTIGVIPDVSVDSSGLVTANCSGWTSIYPLTASGYADSGTSAPIQVSGVKTSQLDTIGATTYTPSNVAQEIAAGKYLTGAQTISAIAPPYYDMSGANAWMGADATLVQAFTLADVKLSATDFNTWTPSTTATDILATRTAGTFTASDMPNYDYWVLWETKIPIVYLSGSENKAKGLYLAAFHVQALIRRASSYANLQAGNLNGNVNLSSFTGGNFYRYYNATLNNLTYTNNTSYGFYATVTANTFSNSTATSPTVTLKTPKVTARCSTTYMSTGNAAVIDKANTVISQKCYVYKVKAPSFMRGIWNNVMRMVQEIDPA